MREDARKEAVRMCHSLGHASPPQSAVARVDETLRTFHAEFGDSTVPRLTWDKEAGTCDFSFFIQECAVSGRLTVDSSLIRVVCHPDFVAPLLMEELERHLPKAA